MAGSRVSVDPRRAPRQRRSRETVAVLLQAAAQVFASRGYTATTTNHVAERAGLSIGTLYQYFPNKDALLFALAGEHLDTAGAALATVASDLRRQSPPLPVVVRRLVETAAAANDGPLFTVIFNEAPRTPELRARISQLQATMADEVVWHLNRLQVAGDDPYLTAIAVVHAVDALVHHVIADPPPQRTRQQCVDAAIALTLSYLTADRTP